jgi:hypothetical protein
MWLMVTLLDSEGRLLRKFYWTNLQIFTKLPLKVSQLGRKGGSR